jgi:hypothetical protein
MTFQFKIQIKNITRPPVWRRILIADSVTFEHFHQVIQTAFGWEDYHLFEFSAKGFGSSEVIGTIDEEFDDLFEGTTKLDASQTKLSEIFESAGQKYTYIYDFGDDWAHQIMLEDILSDTLLRPELLAGKGACPPEDCGGVWGYAELKEILSDRKHPEYKEMKQWLGLKPKQDWDPNYFDLKLHQMAVRLC